MPLILKTPQFIAAIISGLIVIAAFVYVKNLGYSEKEKEVIIEAVKQNDEARKIRENAHEVVRDTDDIDGLLISLGIMRNRDDR